MRSCWFSLRWWTVCGGCAAEGLAVLWAAEGTAVFWAVGAVELLWAAAGNNIAAMAAPKHAVFQV
jgi:hypothetical protein